MNSAESIYVPKVACLVSQEFERTTLKVGDILRGVKTNLNWLPIEFNGTLQILLNEKCCLRAHVFIVCPIFVYRLNVLSKIYNSKTNHHLHVRMFLLRFISS